MTILAQKHPSLFSRMMSELHVARLVWVTNIRATMENRAAFGMQVVGMMLNDFAFVAVWTLFFQAVGTVNGWGGWESIGLLGFGTASFGLAFGFGGGATWLPRYVEDATMDDFLLSPRNILWRTATSKFDVPAFGDAVFGVILLVVFAVKMHLSLNAVLLLLGCLLPTALLTFSMSLIAGCLSFYLLDAKLMTNTIFKMFLTPSLYPSGLFPSGAKFFFIFIIPSLVVGGLPVEAVEQGSFPLFFLIWTLGIAWLLLAIMLFSFSVRRYESGNAIGLRSGN